MIEKYKIYAGGQFVESDQIIQICNPFNNEVFATTFLANNAIFETAVAAALKVKEEMKTMPSHKRYSILMFISNEIKKDRDRLAKILALEAGKPFLLALGEIDRSAQTFLVAAEETKRLPGEYLSIDWTPAGEGKEGWVKYFPVGLVAGIAPFNFPLNLASHKIAPAIAAGCPIVLKPASSTPLSTLELAKIIDRSELPKGSVSILPMDRNTGNQLVTDPRFQLLSFTGSPEVGWKMKQNAGKKKVILELGGNAGVIVSKSANVDNAIKKCMTGAFAYQGQVCIHTQRILVHENLFSEFCARFTEETKKLVPGSPLDSNTQISAMIDEGNAKRVEEWVNEAVSLGAELLTGGKRNCAFFEPTVLTKTHNEMKVNCCEVFGPVVTLEPFSDFDKAIDIINNSEFGLQAGIFTDSLTEMNQAFENLETGGVIINDVPTFRVDHMPYGGIKDSGLGREGVKYAILDMLEPKLLIKNKG